MSKTSKPAGYILYKGKGFNGKPIVVIATLHSENVKTGDMVQIWILIENIDPVTGTNEGFDVVICGTCPHRSKASGGAGTCYVNVGQAPGAIWRAYKNGNYPMWDGTDAQLEWMFSGRATRFGAYGDPVLIPVDLVARIASKSKKWSGYTHAWTTSPAYRDYFMASVDSVRERENAASHGWRTFRIGQDPIDGEIACPASEEAGKKTTCERCGLCAGAERQAKDIVIRPHGRSGKRIALSMV